MPQSQYARDQGLEYGYTATVLTRPTAWYLSAHTAYPGDTGTTIANELTSGTATSYARQSVTLALSSHVIASTNAPVFTAGGTWPTVTYLGICDALTAGNLWDYIELSQGGATYFLAAAQPSNPGSGYAVNDVLTLTGGGGATLTIDAVATVNSVTGIPTQWHVTAAAHGSVSAIPANPMACTGGTGTGATWLASWLAAPQSFQLNNTDTLTFAIGQILVAMG